MHNDSYNIKLVDLFLESLQTSATVEVIYQMLLKQDSEKKDYWNDHRRREILERTIRVVKSGGPITEIPETLWAMEAELIDVRRRLGLPDFSEGEY